MRASLIGCALLGFLPAVAAAVTMEMVTVGDPGNPPDPLNTNIVPDIGSVPYTYQIGKFEVYNSQYVEFLNSVAMTDAHGLYNTQMSSDASGGIMRSGSSGSYIYSLKSGYGNLPVVFVDFYDTVRFVNWLENGQPAPTNQVPGTTETGSYTLFTDGGTTTNVSARAANATWVIPTENEWYKAAHYQPSDAGGPSDGYWFYPTQSDSVPNSRPPNGIDTNSANFFRDLGPPYDLLNDGFAKTGSSSYSSDVNYLTPVGGYSVADSYYGTFDQAGNAREWNESNATIGSLLYRGLRGGSWSNVTAFIGSSMGGVHVSSAELDDIGFRVAAIFKVPALVAGRLTNGAVRLDLEGSVGFRHWIEVSEDLTDWQPWVRVALPPHGWCTNVPVEPDTVRRFWRARLGSVPPSFVPIPAGEFQMGNAFDPSDGEADELPRHTVYVSAFYMQATETTKTQWDDVRAWASTNGYYDLSPGGGKAASHPVQDVNWYDAVKWCNARSEKEGLTPCYYTDGAQTNVYRGGQLEIDSGSVNWNANGYRLPTEAEWEKAARGGTGGRRFPWKDADTITHAWANYCSSASYPYDVSPTQGNHPDFNHGDLPLTSPVGYFEANGYGLFDMAGNVWEWCWDTWGYTYYSSSPPSDPTGPTSLFGIDSRVVRGGDWDNSEYWCRVGCRGINFPSNSSLNVGFRPVRR